MRLGSLGLISDAAPGAAIRGADPRVPERDFRHGRVRIERLLAGALVHAFAGSDPQRAAEARVWSARSARAHVRAAREVMDGFRTAAPRAAFARLSIALVTFEIALAGPLLAAAPIASAGHAVAESIDQLRAASAPR